jgi:hypothetical protein
MHWLAQASRAGRRSVSTRPAWRGSLGKQNNPTMQQHWPARTFSGKSPAKANGPISSSGSLETLFSSGPRPRQTTGSIRIRPRTLDAESPFSVEFLPCSMRHNLVPSRKAHWDAMWAEGARAILGVPAQNSSQNARACAGGRCARLHPLLRRPRVAARLRRHPRPPRPQDPRRARHQPEDDDNR